MKIIKYLLFLILLLFIGSAIYFGTKDGTYDIQDSQVINAPIEVVFSEVNDFKNWENWGPWKKEDPTISFTYAEKTSGEGASFSWDGKTGGSMTTTKVIPNSEIQQEVTLKNSGRETHAKVHWFFEEVAEGTKVTWKMEGEHSLMEKAYYSWSGFDFNTAIHQMHQAGLKGIEGAVEEAMKQYSINVDGITQYGGGYYMYTTSVAKMDELGKKMKPMMEVVKNFVAKNNLNMAGKPFVLYNEIDKTNQTVIFSTGIPVKEQVITPEGSPVVCGIMEPVTAVKITLKGNYEHLPEAYSKGMEYLQKNGQHLDPTQKTFEVYSTDPETTPNPAEWLTEVYLPILEVPKPDETNL